MESRNRDNLISSLFIAMREKDPEQRVEKLTLALDNIQIEKHSLLKINNKNIKQYPIDLNPTLLKALDLYPFIV